MGWLIFQKKMVKALLELKILDPEKIKSYNKLKKKVASIHINFALILFFSMYSKHSTKSIVELLNVPLIIPVILIGVLAIVTTYLIAFFYIKVPSQGSIEFHKASLFFKFNNEHVTINLGDLLKLIVYINNESYYIGIQKNDTESIYEIDLIFRNDKILFFEIINDWSIKGLEVEIKSDKISPSLSKFNNLSPYCDTRPKSIQELSNYKIKIQGGILFKAKTNIPYDKFSKEYLFILALESLKNLDWGLEALYPDLIYGVTDKAFKYLGYTILISFSEKEMSLTCEEYGDSIFAIGLKVQIKTFLTTMSELIGELEPDSAKKRYNDIFNQ